MSSSVAIVRTRHGLRKLNAAQLRERWIRRRVAIAWSLLVLNVLTFDAGQSVLAIPGTVGKGITQGALPLALLVALTVNRRLVIRPNVFLCLMSLLVIEATVTVVTSEYLRGTGYRTFRFAEFVVALWLLTPYWGRRDMLLVRCHLKVMAWVLASVVLGLMVSPGHALPGGRLSGALWPIPPTQVAHYAAVTGGLVAVLWLCGEWRGPSALVIVLVTLAILILSHTRTALVAMVAGLLIAGLSLIVAKTRVRKALTASCAVGLIAGATLSSAITSWLARGQGAEQLAGLSGRTTFWEAVLTTPRTKFQELFGFGLSNDSFGGLPIDSNWIASYQSQGLFGVAVCASILLFLLLSAYFQPRGVQRALALFLIIYCLVASFTEVGFTNASTYLLDLTVAASLIVQRPEPS
jgi:hypothetical protein